MILTIKNCDDEKYIELLTEYVNYCIETLLNEKKRKKIKISIEFGESQCDYGSTLIIGKNKSDEPREFLIAIRKNMNAHMTLETIAHELVHLKQFVLCELNESVDKWKGKKYKLEKIDYNLLPWEIEANGIAYALFFNYCVKFELWNIFNDIENPYEFYQQKNIWKT